MAAGSDCPDGTISAGEFRSAASALAERWHDCGNSGLPPWSWVSPPRKQPWLFDQVDGYLSMEQFCLSTHGKGNDNSCCTSTEEKLGFDDYDDDCGGDLFVDDATLVESGNPEMHRYYDFHIVYSSTYRVPVLYFRVYGSDGRPLSLAEFEGDLAVGSADELLKSKQAFITQEEHPFLNQPWYKLHPCGTSEWLRLLFHSDASLQTRDRLIELYLVSWLSYVGQLFGLCISSDTIKNLKQL